jgi:malonate-semialdehyde dehydrogenase (acetylating) / methylmalonate-semialdehyde dehydrogenase
VGSTPIAKYIYETGTANGKRVQALGGAKNHMLVLSDADVDMAADAAIGAGYGSAGERCMAISVVLASESIADDLVAKIAERIPGVKVGPGNEARQRDGPVDHRRAPRPGEGLREQRARGRRHAGRRRARRRAGRRVLPEPHAARQRHDRDVVLPRRDLRPGPQVVRVDGYQEGIDTINANPYANGTAIFTRDGGAARQFQFDVQVGMVGINVPVPVPVSYYSFGGWKASLFGDTHMYGPEGINFYTQAKVVTSRWPDPRRAPSISGFPETR